MLAEVKSGSTYFSDMLTSTDPVSSFNIDFFLMTVSGVAKKISISIIVGQNRVVSCRTVNVVCSIKVDVQIQKIRPSHVPRIASIDNSAFSCSIDLVIDYAVVCICEICTSMNAALTLCSTKTLSDGPIGWTI